VTAPAACCRARGRGPKASCYFYCNRLSVGSSPPRWELTRGLIPVVDARLFVPAEHPAYYFGDPLQARPLRLQQPGEHLPQLRHRQRRDFFPPVDPSPGSGTTAPTATASCGDASPPNSVPRNGPTRPPPCPPATPPRPRAAGRGPPPPAATRPRPACSTACTRPGVRDRPCGSPPAARAGRGNRLHPGLAPTSPAPAPPWAPWTRPPPRRAASATAAGPWPTRPRAATAAPAAPGL